MDQKVRGRPKGYPKSGGRKPGSVNKVTAEVRELAGQYGPMALAELARLAEHAESEQARVSACKEILDRAYGKSAQSIDRTDKVDTAEVEVSNLEVARRIAYLLTEGAQEIEAISEIGR